jgi:hypothetical protein
MSLTHDSKAILFSDNTSVLVTNKDYTIFKQKMNLALTTSDKLVQVPLDISFKDNVLGEVNSTKFLGMHINNHMNWKTHIEQISHKLR